MKKRMLIVVFFQSIKKRVKKGGGTKTLPSASGTPTHSSDNAAMQSNAPIDPSDAIGWAVVKYNYVAQQMDELSLTKGILGMFLI